MLRAMYCSRALPVQHLVNPGQLYVTEAQPPLAPPSECVCSFWQTYVAARLLIAWRITHTEKNLWPWDLKFNRVLEVVQVYVQANFHQANAVVHELSCKHWNREKQKRVSDNAKNNTAVATAGSKNISK